MKRFYSLGLLSLALMIVQPVVASMNIGASRIIINANENSKSVDINNRSSAQPYLINVDISRDISGKPAEVPFLVAPALFRLEAGAVNKVRVIKKSVALPNDRESVFYFNVMAIPAGKEGEVRNSSSVGGEIQVATGNTIKLFYRPINLPMTQQEAMGKLQFLRDGKGTMVVNPTPYYISLAKLVINGKDATLNVINGSSMLAPFAHYTYPVASQSGSRVEWKAINDFGGKEVFQSAVN